jgi:hypothetical protein
MNTVIYVVWTAGAYYPTSTKRIVVLLCVLLKHRVEVA